MWVCWITLVKAAVSVSLFVDLVMRLLFHRQVAKKSMETGYSSVVEYLPRVQETLGWFRSMEPLCLNCLSLGTIYLKHKFLHQQTLQMYILYVCV